MTDRSPASLTEPETLRRPPAAPAAVFGGAREFHFERHHFDLIAGLLYQLAGIALAPHKAEMVYARLARRLRELRLPDFDAYCALLQSDGVADEIGFLVNALTTNLTSFYRESHHFDFLASTVLPELRTLNAHKPKPRLRLWSAGCSSGPEPYTMAMVLVSAMGAELRRWDARILATDIDTHMVETARRGIYPLSGATGIPPAIRQRFTTDTRLDGEPAVAMGEELKRLVTVKPLNLLEHWPMSGPFDAIFCRNVLIYFDRRGRMQVIENFARMLRPGGYLFLGHSESLYGVSNLFRQAGPTIYRREGAMNAEPLPRQEPASATPRNRMGSGRYFNREFNADTVKIGLGQQAVSDRPDLMIATTLGSCVAACINDPVRGIGGMNHFMLPDLPASELEGAGMAARYGSVAMERLINALLAAGAERLRLQVKLFGGGRVIESSYDIGGLNCRFALDYVRMEGLTLAGHDLGGGSARRVHYFPHSGRALRRLLRPEAAADTVTRERRFITHLSQAPEEGEVELFTPADPEGS